MEYLKFGLIGITVLGFLFQAFRRLRDDYGEQRVVGASVLGVFFCSFFWWIGGKYELGIFAILMGIIVLLFWLSTHSGWRFWPTLESITIPGLEALIIAQTATLIDNFSWSLIFRAAASLIALFSCFFWRNYRRFSWYPSGRSGFLFLAALTTLSLIMLPLDFWQKRLLELGVWGIMLIAGLSGIILLSGKKSARVN